MSTPLYIVNNLFHCSQGTGGGGGATATVGGGGTSENRKSSVHEKDSTLEKRGGTPEPNRRRDTRSGSMSSQTSRSTLEDSYSAEREAKKQDSVAALTQNFCPVTLTVNVFFRQVNCNQTREQKLLFSRFLVIKLWDISVITSTFMAS